MIGASTNYGPLTLKSSVAIKDACVIVDQQVNDPLRDMAGHMSRWMIDTRDAQVRAGLIALGWTPPQEGA